MHPSENRDTHQLQLHPSMDTARDGTDKTKTSSASRLGLSVAVVPGL